MSRIKAIRLTVSNKFIRLTVSNKFSLKNFPIGKPKITQRAKLTTKKKKILTKILQIICPKHLPPNIRMMKTTRRNILLIMRMR